jgi:hypothetical protein
MIFPRRSASKDPTHTFLYEAPNCCRQQKPHCVVYCTVHLHQKISYKIISSQTESF